MAGIARAERADHHEDRGQADRAPPGPAGRSALRRRAGRSRRSSSHSAHVAATTRSDRGKSAFQSQAVRASRPDFFLSRRSPRMPRPFLDQRVRRRCSLVTRIAVSSASSRVGIELLGAAVARHGQGLERVASAGASRSRTGRRHRPETSDVAAAELARRPAAPSTGALAGALAGAVRPRGRSHSVPAMRVAASARPASSCVQPPRLACCTSSSSLRHGREDRARRQVHLRGLGDAASCGAAC